MAPVQSCNNFRRFLENLTVKLAKITLAFLLVFIFPVFILLISPMHIIRLVVKQLARLFRPDLGKMLTCCGATIANASNTLNTPRLVIVIKSIYTGRGDCQKFKELCMLKYISAKKEDGELLYPEMSQFLTSWFGFRFWSQDKDFDISNHIRVVDFAKPVVTIDDLKTLEEELLTAPFKECQSPWEVILVHDVSINPEKESGNTAVIYRFSHALADGYSLIKLHEALSEVTKCERIKPSYPSKTILETITFPLKFFYVMAEMIFQTFQTFPFKIPVGARTFKDNLQKADIISTATIKSIKNSCNVSFTSVIISLTATAFRSMALESGMVLTRTVPCVIPIPKPGHPSKLRNHFTLASLNLPIGEADPMKRLQLCHKEYERIKSSAYPAVSYCIMMALGGCFDFVGRALGQNNVAAISISYLPMPFNKSSLDGHEMLTQSFCFTQSGAIGCVITISSFDDQIAMYTTADSAILPRESLLGFQKIIKEEVDILLKAADSFSKA